LTHDFKLPILVDIDHICHITNGIS
jgi:hypothetical protein